MDSRSPHQTFSQGGKFLAIKGEGEIIFSSRISKLFFSYRHIHLANGKYIIYYGRSLNMRITSQLQALPLPYDNET